VCAPLLPLQMLRGRLGLFERSPQLVRLVRPLQLQRGELLLPLQQFAARRTAMKKWRIVRLGFGTARQKPVLE
jgi:hypothetical protein